jgi:hypothetical protein
LLFLYWCEIGCVTLREVQRLTVPDIRVLRKLFWLKRKKGTEKWRKIHKEELHDFYHSANLGDLTTEKATTEECDPYVEDLMSFTQENAVDQQSLSRVP